MFYYDKSVLVTKEQSILNQTGWKGRILFISFFYLKYLRILLKQMGEDQS